MVKLYTPKNRLKEKVGDGGFNPVHVEDAQALLDDNEIDFVPIGYRFLDDLDQAITGARDPSSDDLRIQVLNSLTQLRAQGAMFGYASITFVTDVLVDFMDSLDRIDAKIVAIVEQYSKSARIILSTEIRDENHEVCVSLIKELHEVCRRYKDKYG